MKLVLLICRCRPASTEDVEEPTSTTRMVKEFDVQGDLGSAEQFGSAEQLGADQQPQESAILKADEPEVAPTHRTSVVAGGRAIEKGPIPRQKKLGRQSPRKKLSLKRSSGLKGKQSIYNESTSQGSVETNGMFTKKTTRGRPPESCNALLRICSARSR